MKVIKMQYLILAILLGTCFSPLLAQRGPGGGRGFDPNEMIQREKQNVYKAIDDLSADQKLLLDGIYDELGTSFKELIDEVRQTRDFKTLRPKMQALSEEKDGLIKDVLNEDQYLIYAGIVDERKKQRGNRPPRGEGKGKGQGNPPESVQ